MSASEDTIPDPGSKRRRDNQTCRALNEERLRILAECLTGPAAPHRAAWFAAWGAVADAARAGDAEGAVRGLESARDAFAALDAAAAVWLTAARAWLARAGAVNPAFTSVVGVEGVATEFGSWACGVDRIGSLRGLPCLMQRQYLVYDTVLDCVDVLVKIAEGVPGEVFRTLLDETGGPSWLLGLTAAAAAAVAEPPEGYDFREVDLPATDEQREHADFLLRLAAFAYENVSYAVAFRGSYTSTRATARQEQLCGSPTAVSVSSEPVELGEGKAGTHASPPSRRPAMPRGHRRSPLPLPTRNTAQGSTNRNRSHRQS